MLVLKKVSKTYPNNFQATLKEVDLHLLPGDFCIIIGSNGSGKSSLLKTISKEISIDSGEVITNGNTSVVTQDINKGTIPELTLLENIVLSEIAYKDPSLKFYRYSRERIALELSKLNLGLEKYLDTPLCNLSGGQKQMIAIFMAIHSRAEILLLDEHTSALDPRMQEIVMQYTDQAIKENKLTSLMITHKLSDAIKYGNRLIMLDRGRIVLDLDQKQKQSLSLDNLLDLFHKFEDQSFRGQNV